MWFRLGVDVPLTDEEEKRAINGDGDVIVNAMMRHGFSISGDSYVPEPCSPTGEEEDLQIPDMDCKLVVNNKNRKLWKRSTSWLKRLFRSL